MNNAHLVQLAQKEITDVIPPNQVTTIDVMNKLCVALVDANSKLDECKKVYSQPGRIGFVSRDDLKTALGLADE